MKLYIQILFILMIPAWAAATGPADPVFPWLSSANVSDPESLFVHIDRNIYISGEAVRFSIYLLDNPSFNDNDRSKVAYLEIINSSNTPVAEYRAGLNGSFSEGIISIPDSVTSGAYYLRAYTALMKNSAPDSFFRKDILIYNPFDGGTIETVKSSDGEPAETDKESGLNGLISIEVEGGSVLTARQDTRVSVNFDDSILPESKPGAITISVAVSEIDLPVTGKEEVRVIDNQSEEIGPIMNYQKENSGPYFEGTILSRNRMEPGNEILLYLSTPSRQPGIRYTYSDDEGNFRFLIDRFEGEREIYIQPSDYSSDWLIKANSPFSDRFNYKPGWRINWTEELVSLISRMAVNYQVSKIYSEFEPVAIERPGNGRVSKRFYGKPDIDLNLNEYIVLPSMEEVFYELVPGVGLRKNRSGFFFILKDEITGEKTFKPGAVMINGVLIDNPGEIAILNPESVEKIEIIKGEYQVGNIMFNGIISIILKEGENPSPDITSSGFRAAYTTIDMPRYIPNLVYGNTRPKGSPLPDFRNTLYWSTGTEPDSDGNISFEFFTSDFCTTYTITVSGIGNDGKIFSASKEFRVVSGQ